MFVTFESMLTIIEGLGWSILSPTILARDNVSGSSPTGVSLASFNGRGIYCSASNIIALLSSFSLIFGTVIILVKTLVSGSATITLGVEKPDSLKNKRSSLEYFSSSSLVSDKRLAGIVSLIPYLTSSAIPFSFFISIALKFLIPRSRPTTFIRQLFNFQPCYI